ncbi:MAG: inositol monophosphatase family protein [Candidatus Dormibacteria bacterium]
MTRDLDGPALRAWATTFSEIGRAVMDEVRGLSGTEAARAVVGRGASGDWTTGIDDRAEKVVLAKLSQWHRSGHRFTVLAEESGEVDMGDALLHVLVDPIDGSLNAKMGIPAFALSMALLDGRRLGDTLVGYTINLVSGDQVCAVRGAGCTLNGDLVTGALLEEPRGGRIPVLTLEASEPVRSLAVAMPLLAETSKLRLLGSVALHLAGCATGAVSVAAAPLPIRAFDTAAGWLQVREAGGAVTDALGHGLELVPVAFQSRTTLVASLSPELHRVACRALSAAPA